MNKSFRKFFSLALASGMIVTTAMPTIVQAQTKPEISSSLEKVSATLQQNPIKSNVDTKTEETVSIIVELKEAPLAVSKYSNSTYSSKSQTNIEKQQKDFIDFAKKLEGKKSTYTTKIEFGASYKTVFNGMAMKLPGKDVEKLLESGLVKTIYKNDTVQLDLPTEKQSKSQNSEIAPLMHDSLNDMNVAKLHDQGIKGKGMKIGVLDTGIDYNHPDLKENYKGGYDCVDEDDSPMEATYEDWKKKNEEDPLMYPEQHPLSGSTYYTSHGTHVSGTVAANGKNSESEFAVTGVAPEADLYVYRVLGPYGSGSFEDIIQGVEMAVEQEMDVINLSLGSDSADPLSPLSIVCDNAMLAGTTTVLANGNAGPNLSTVGTPASSKLSISIGASTTAIKLPVYDISLGDLKVNSNTFSRRFDASIADLENKNLEIVDCGLGQASDFEGKDLKEKVALIQRGELSFNEKLINAKNAGCSLVLLYNNVDGEIPYYLGESNDYASSLALTQAEGESIKAALESSSNSTVTIKQNGETSTQKDLLADFSSRGPVPGTVDIKPDLVAPGASIFSTYPEFINHKEEGNDYSSAYARISGTSMAAPHVAGLAALIESQNPEYTSFDTKVALMNTSDDLAQEYGVNEVGAGRANALESVESKISIRAKGQTPTILPDGEVSSLDFESGSLSFGKVGLEDKTVTVKDELVIKNNSSKTNSFDVSVEYVKPTKENGAKDAVKNNVKLDVKETATASKNKETKLGVTLSIPKNAEHGVYQGYIRLKSTRNENEEYKIPFSVQAVKPGVGDIQLLNPGMTNDVNSILMGDGVIGIESLVSFRSPMDKLHILVRDSKTNEVIGFVETLDAEGVPTDVDLYVGYIMNQHSTVRAVKNGKLQNYTTDLKEGIYTMDLMGEANGKFYSSTHPIVIDNNPLDVSFKLNGKELPSKPQVIEMKKDLFTTQEDIYGNTHTAVWVNGIAYDSSIDDLKAAGVEEYPLLQSKVDQTLNSIRYYLNDTGHIGGFFKSDAKGEFKFGVTADDVSKLGYEVLDVESLDISYARDARLDRVTLAFVEEGRSYIEPSYDKDVLKMDDQAKLSLKFNNLKDVKTLETTLMVNDDVQAKNIKLSGKYNKDFKITTKETSVEADAANPSHKLIDIKVEPKKDAVLNGAVDLIEVGVKLKNETSNVYDKTPIRINSVKTYDSNKKELECLNLIAPAIIKDTKSSIKGGATSDALIAAHPTAVLDPAKHKAKIFATDSNGKVYDAKLLNSGSRAGRMNYSIENLNPTDEFVKLTIDLPGHFPISNNLLVGKLMNDKIYSKVAASKIDFESIPGDVNSDNVIDIKDAQAIAKVFNQTGDNLGEVDLTQDKTVDSLDMYFVVKNFGIQNPEKPGTKPQGTKDQLNKILEDIKYEEPDFGLE